MAKNDDIDTELTLVAEAPKDRRKEKAPEGAPSFPGTVSPCDISWVENGIERSAEFAALYLSRIRRAPYGAQEANEIIKAERASIALIREALELKGLIESARKAKEKPVGRRMA